MPTFEAGTVVRVPFPYTDGERVKHRPALVVSSEGLGPDGSLLWAVMITSAENRRWPDDVLINDYPDVGLTAPSVIRPHKIATLDAHHATRLGELDSVRLEVVLDRIRSAVA